MLGSRQRSFRRRVVLAGACSLALALTIGAIPAQALVIKTFLYTGAEQTFKVPGGVSSLSIRVVGGHGGAATDSVGGEAAEVTGSVNVTPGQTLYVEVGGVGEDIGEGGEGGFNGGGDGAGGGGGASDVRTSPRALGLSPDNRLIVAAGGGGGGGSGPSEAGTDGGAAGSPGVSGEYSGGGAGNQTEGGLGASGCEFGQGENGGRGFGGKGGDSGQESDPGGGGGGGLFGGGGGGGACHVGSSGGGGGSSLKPAGGTEELASASAEPEVQISYTLVPPSISIVSPVNGATFTQGQAVAANYSCTPPVGTTVVSCAGPVANGAPLDTSTPGAHTFIVNAEDADGGTASKEVVYAVVAAPPTTTIAPAVPAVVPNTILGSHPKPVVKTKRSKAKVKFTFSSDVAGATFKCKLDKGSFASCSSPKTYKVKAGKHTFSVVASGPGGTDPTPASFSFKVKKIQ